jgi:hypothetical protein
MITGENVKTNSYELYMEVAGEFFKNDWDRNNIEHFTFVFWL